MDTIMRTISIIVSIIYLINNTCVLGQSSSKIDRFLKVLSIQRDKDSPFTAKFLDKKDGTLPLFKAISNDTFERLFHISSTDNDPKVRTLVKLKNSSNLNSNNSYQINSISGSFATVELYISQLSVLANQENVEFIELGKPVEVNLDESSPKVRAASARSDFGKEGEGVIICVLDTGIDILHNDFKDENDNTRILYIWDQNKSGNVNPPIGYSYGQEWNSNDIINGTCTHEDLGGHGTHVSGIAAGNGRATGNNIPAGTYIGMAPKSDLIITGLDFNNYANVIDGLLWSGTKAASLNWLYGQNLELTLKSYKTEFLKYEPIGISLIVKNNALETIQISGIRQQSEFGYMIHIYNSNRDTLNSESGILTNIPSAIYKLMPGEEVQFNINLLWYSKYEDSNERVTRFGYYFNKGELFINCTLDFDAASLFNKRTNKTFTSNTIKINIIEPTEEDKKGIIEDLKEVARLNKYYEGEQFTESIKKVLDIFDKYQNHPLAQLAYSYLTPRAQSFYHFDKDYYYKKRSKNFPYSISGIAEAAKFESWRKNTGNSYYCLKNSESSFLY